MPAVLALVLPLLAIRAQAADPLDPYLGDPGRTYPNLVPNVQDVHIQPTRTVYNSFGFEEEEEGLFLWFDTQAQNFGTVPVQVTIDEVETPQTSTVSQCVSWRSAEGHVCRETELVGGYAWHEEHGHFHYEDFATYELRSLTPDGRADYSDAGLLRQSGKVSFCFYDIRQVDPDSSPVPFYTEGNCAAPVVMGVSPGWTDIYSSGLPGQNIDIAGLPSGEYALTTHMNYERTLRETDYEDNFIEVQIRITDTDEIQYLAGKKVEILEKRWPTPDERVPTATTTTTTTIATTTTTIAEPPTLERVRTLGGRALSSTPVVRRRPPAVPRTSECPSWHSSCKRSWATGR